MLKNFNKNLDELIKNYQDNIKKHSNIHLRFKCIILRALFEQYCYQILIITNLINYEKTKMTNKLKDNFNSYRDKLNNKWNNKISLEKWINKRIESKYKTIWSDKHKGVISIFKVHWFDKESKIPKTLLDFYNNYYKKWLVSAQHSKNFDIDKKTFNTLSSKMDDIFANYITNEWLNMTVYVITTNSSRDPKKHIKQKGTIVCAAAPTNPRYRKETKSTQFKIGYILNYIYENEIFDDKGLRLSDSGESHNYDLDICRYCILRILGKTNFKNFVSWKEIKKLLSKNTHIIEKLKKFK